MLQNEKDENCKMMHANLLYIKFTVYIVPRYNFKTSE